MPPVPQAGSYKVLIPSAGGFRRENSKIGHQPDHFARP